MVLVEGVGGVSCDGALLREARYNAAQNRDRWGVSVKTAGQAREDGAAGSVAVNAKTSVNPAILVLLCCRDIAVIS